MRRRMLVAFIAVLLSAGIAPGALRAAGPAFTTERNFITSFDGTRIVYNLYKPSAASATNPVPVILRTHGWGGSGDAGTSAGVQMLLSNGYAVLTWDSRGFGQSGGEANVDSPEYEVKDAQALVGLVAGRAEIAKNAGDPIIGMTGGSYAGGIQLALAAYDSRVDAIAPEITWNDLNRSLWQGDVIKLGWGELLYGSGLATAASGGIGTSNTAGIQTGAYAPFIHESEASGAALGYPTDKMKSDFGAVSLKNYFASHPVTIPTLLMQGKTDTLFDLSEAYANFKAIQQTGAPVKLVSFCGGHAGCPAANLDGATARSEQDAQIIAWFDKYLKGNANANTGTAVRYSLADGTWHDAADLPTAANPGPAALVDVSGDGTIVNPGSVNAGDSAVTLGPVVTDASTAGEPGTMSVHVLTNAEADTQIVGIGHVNGTITGAGSGTNLIFKLVDTQTGHVIDLQAATLRIDGPFAPGITKSFDVDLVGVTELLPKGHPLDLQISTTGLPHASYRGAGTFNIHISHAIVPTLP